ncbi:PREDICTED: uncharacterized protein LOC109211306 isoform X2 [Nicotiana attenuata]|uniref:uncharacterized protein LOC109211306 isoform X2 n=1 Tax=Nicotiana attenuata TaxID=49451 RepID=UPI00090506A9|nr:PREDICTED: uncharacterized protein LOC109211306 isoform X2 [Nicotiana attenuata]
MQILQWLFKNANETNSNITSSKKEAINDQEVKSKEIVQCGISPKKRRAGKLARSSCKIFNVLNILRRRDIAADYFVSTINLKRLGSTSRRKQRFVHCIKMKKQSLSRGLSFHRKADSAKVLPVTEAVVTHRNGKEQSPSAEKKEKAKGDKIKTISKMKELIRWAAAAKSEKGGKYFGRKLRDRSVLKAVPDNDQLSNDSPKISFRWDVESCSTISSAISVSSLTKNEHSINKPRLNSTLVHIDQCPAAARKGNWVTTDSEFVVLELELEL